MLSKVLLCDLCSSIYHRRLRSLRNRQALLALHNVTHPRSDLDGDVQHLNETVCFLPNKSETPNFAH